MEKCHSFFPSPSSTNAVFVCLVCAVTSAARYCRKTRPWLSLYPLRDTPNHCASSAFRVSMEQDSTGTTRAPERCDMSQRDVPCCCNRRLLHLTYQWTSWELLKKNWNHNFFKIIPFLVTFLYYSVEETHSTEKL